MATVKDKKHGSFHASEESIVSAFINKYFIIAMSKDVINLIIQYYKTKIMIFMHSVCNKRMDEFTVYNTNNQNLCTLNYKDESQRVELYDPYCYVTNISQLLSIHSKNTFLSKYNINLINDTYDGIICFSQKLDNDKEWGLSMLFFDDINTKKPAKNILYDMHHSKVNNKKINKFIFCGENHGIIGSHYDFKLQQLKLQNIDDIDDIKFTQICSGMNASNHSWYYTQDRYTEMIYLNNTQKILCIDCDGGLPASIESYFIRDTYSKRYCSMFDLNTREIKSIKEYRYKGSGGFSCSLCNDYNDIYMITNVCTISKYDGIKNEWIDLYQQNYHHIDEAFKFQIYQEPKLWFNNINLLCWAYVDGKKTRFKYIDIRMKNSAISMYQNEIIPKNKDFYDTVFI